jgi:hypothetical protein
MLLERLASEYVYTQRSEAAMHHRERSPHDEDGRRPNRYQNHEALGCLRPTAVIT